MPNPTFPERSFETSNGEVIRTSESVGRFDVKITKPHRISRAHMVASRVGDAVRIQRARAGRDGIVVVLFDADDDDWQSATRKTRCHLSDTSDTIVAVAVREYEAWFLVQFRSASSDADRRAG